MIGRQFQGISRGGMLLGGLGQQSSSCWCCGTTTSQKGGWKRRSTFYGRSTTRRSCARAQGRGTSRCRQGWWVGRGDCSCCRGLRLWLLQSRWFHERRLLRLRPIGLLLQFFQQLFIHSRNGSYSLCFSGSRRGSRSSSSSSRRRRRQWRLLFQWFLGRSGQRRVSRGHSRNKFPTGQTCQ